MSSTLCDSCDKDMRCAALEELVRGMHAAYVGAIDKCEGLDESLTWEYSCSIDADIAKIHAGYEQDRHRFDVAIRELGIEGV